MQRRIIRGTTLIPHRIKHFVGREQVKGGTWTWSLGTDIESSCGNWNNFVRKACGGNWLPNSCYWTTLKWFNISFFFLTSYIIIIVNLQLYQEFLIIYHLNLTINGDLSRTAIASLTMVTHHTHWQTQIQFGPRAESCCRGSRGMIGTHGTVSASNRHFALSSAWSLFFLDLPVLRSLDTEAEGCWNKLKHRIYLQEDIAVLALPDPWLDLTSHFAGRGLQRSVLVFPQFVPIGRGKTGGVHGAYGGSESSIAAMQCNGLRRVTHLQQISDGSGDRIVDWPGWAISHQRSEDREHSHICRLGNWMRLNGIASYLPH